MFDHSSCHAAMADDALNASKMNKNPGGKQPRMRDTVWNGRAQRMVFPDGTPKGLDQVLRERGINTRKMKLDDMREELASHSDFRDEKSQVEHFLNSRGHGCIMLPKFHCELNPIERCWAQSKRFTRSHAKYNIESLRKNIPAGLDSITLENIQNYFRKARQYMFAYLQGETAGTKLEERIKYYKKQYKSHRRIHVNE